MPENSITPCHGSYLLPQLEHARAADAMHPGILSTRDVSGVLAWGEM